MLSALGSHDRGGSGLSRGVIVAAALVATLAEVSPSAAQAPPVTPGSAVSQVSPRDAQGRLTLRATRQASPLRIDGKLDEPAYASVQSVTDFIQMEPAGGQPASEKTEVWVFFDERNVYVTMRAWESRPDLMVANEMRRDSNNILMSDHVGFSLDTFHDGRRAIAVRPAVYGRRPQWRRGARDRGRRRRWPHTR